jgi:hypothetical protein
MVGGNPRECCKIFRSVGIHLYGAILMRMQCLLCLSYRRMTGAAAILPGRLSFALGECGFFWLPTCCAL